MRERDQPKLMKVQGGDGPNPPFHPLPRPFGKPPPFPSTTKAINKTYTQKEKGRAKERERERGERECAARRANPCQASRVEALL